jgi:D-glycero-D-manno-heptose 1,7-bisphosphate phosphatase
MNKYRALLLDRDGVINVDHNFVGSVDRFDFMPGLFPFLRSAQDRGYRLAVLTNQSGVARGRYTAADHDAVTAYMLDGLKREGIAVDLTLVSYHHPEGTIAAYARESFWRKPNPGMVLEAVRRLDLDPARSAFLGDALRDMHAALAGGIKTCVWLNDKATEIPLGVTVVKNFDDALKFL